MATHDPISLDAMGEIPDPVAGAPTYDAGPVPAASPPAERSPTRAERRARARVVVAFAALWMGAALAVFGLRSDAPSPGVMAPILAWALSGAAVLLLVLRPRARGLPAGVRVVQHALWVVPVAYAIGVAVFAGPGDGPLTWDGVRGCMIISTLIAVGPLAAAAVLLRGSFLSAPGWRGAAVGALAGLAGSIGIHAHCPAQGLSHLLAGHGTVIAAGAALGAALGRIGGRA
jgi:hypothetical protein